ncbi:MAG TPA: glycosyltransferase family 1 protein [Candidatus Acidoferrum sp.]|nr:glycosyltransferase family 1 protein [Candidatus Acidoferrum sp.]
MNATIVGDRPTGLGVYALSLIHALDALGERLVVYTSRPEAVRAPGARVERAPAAVRPEHGTRGHLARAVWTQTGLRLRLARLRPRALLNIMPEGLVRPAMPQVTIVHDVLPLQSPEEYPRQQYYFRHYVPAVLRDSRAVIISSESSRRDVLDFYRLPPENLHVVPLGYDPRRFWPSPSPTSNGGPYVLLVGNVMPHKNLLRAIDAFARAVGDGPGRLVIRGGGRAPHVLALRQRIAAAGIAGRVDWRPYAADDELVDLYRGARALLLPSLYEGFGLTALEAMACGTPVITSNRSSLPEVVGDAALLVDPEDVTSIAAAIHRLLTDDALAKTLSALGLARAHLFSWEKTARTVRAILHDVMEGRNR